MVFIFALLTFFIFACLIKFFIDGFEIESMKSHIIVSATFAFIFSVLFNIMAIHSIKGMTHNKEFLGLSAPLYQKIDVSQNEEYYILKDKISIHGKIKPYFVCRVNDFEFGGLSMYGHIFYYDKYFKMLDEYSRNLGGYFKYNKAKEFYVKDSLVLSDNVRFRSKEELRRELERKWSEYREETGANFSPQREQDIKSIKSEEYYFYELRIPQKYWYMLVAFQDSNIRGPSKHDLHDPYKEVYEKAPFLSIFYLYDLSKRILI